MSGLIELGLTINGAIDNVIHGLDKFRPLEPKKILFDGSQDPRPIENCWWFKKDVQVDFDLEPGQLPQDPLQRELLDRLNRSFKGMGIPQGQRPSPKSNMIIGFYDIPEGPGSLYDRVPEVDPMMVIEANKKYFSRDENRGKRKKQKGEENALQKNYTVVVTIDEDIAKMPKREAEKLIRMLMVRVGALKVIAIHRSKDENKADYYAFGTMEGGLGIEYTNKHGAIGRLRNRLLTHACAKESGSFKKKVNVISKTDWQNAPVPEFISALSRKLGEWKNIDVPFNIRSVTLSDERVRYINKIMGYSRQSESAIAAYEPRINVPPEYRMGNATGVIVSSISGRFGADKTELLRKDTIPVAIVPKKDYHPGPNDPLSLYGFDRYSLGLTGQRKSEVGGPSIEFDEMSAAMMYSGFVRVSRHHSGKGYKLDPNGDIYLPRVRGFVHMHQGIDEIYDQLIPDLWRSAKELVEYIPANFKDYPFPVGCGKDVMFACSTDAAKRSKAVHYRDSDSGYTLPGGVQVAFFDALDHGTNALMLSEPLPGTDLIPDDPFFAFSRIIDKYSGGVRLSDELAMV